MTAEELRQKGIKFSRSGNNEKAKRYFKRSIAQGCINAINDLGVIYEKENLLRKAYLEYRKAAELNVGVAWSNIANFYKKGLYLKRDINEAIKCYEKAGEFGYTEAYYYLYEIYTSNLFGNKKNYSKAISYLRIGAEKQLNSNDEQYGCIMELNYNLSNGRYVRKSERAAFELIKKAEKLNIGPLLYNLGCHYVYGNGVAKDIEKGKAILIKAMNRGYPNAYHVLGKLYFEGWGGNQDQLLAYLYFRRGMCHGSIRCAAELIDKCYSTDAQAYEYNESTASAVAYTVMKELLKTSPNEELEDKRIFEELKTKYKDKINFEKMERSILNELSKTQERRIIA